MYCLGPHASRIVLQHLLPVVMVVMVGHSNQGAIFKGRNGSCSLGFLLGVRKHVEVEALPLILVSTQVLTTRLLSGGEAASPKFPVFFAEVQNS